MLLKERVGSSKILPRPIAGGPGDRGRAKLTHCNKIKWDLYMALFGGNMAIFRVKNRTIYRS
jgi:hypothetical protein